MEYGNLSLESSEFGYCDANGGSLAGRYYDACFNCVSAGGDTNYIANGKFAIRNSFSSYYHHVPWTYLYIMIIALVALEAGCLQRPNTTDLLGLSNSVFSSSVITIVDPSTIKKSTQSSIHLSIAVIAGIAAGSAGLIAIITAIVFVWCRRRRNRANLGMTPRWGRNNNRHKRQSSFSFRCRNILSSPISPKFFQDLSPMDEHQTYGSLDEQMSGIANGGGGGGRGRYYIESKQKMARHPYETSLDGWGIQEGASPPQAHPDGIIIDQWNTFSFPEKKLNRSKKGGMTIDTTKSMLSAPPAAHKSPKANQFDISPSRVQQQYPPQQQYNTQQFPYAPTDLIVTTTSPQSQTSSHITIKPRTTTMSSQGSGYPKLKSPTTSSPLLRSGGRGEAEPWFPPPPPGPPPSSSPSSRYGRKASGSSIGKARGKRESGSPVESKQIKVSFPGPPMR